MSTHNNSLSSGIIIVALGSVTSLLFLPGCGKNEATGGAMGTATGAVIGASVAGRHNTGMGALVGGLIGNVVGSGIGRAADDEDREKEQEQRERVHASREAMSQHELARMEEENKRLREKWCKACGRHVTLAGAKSCPSCGGELISKRQCPQCNETFNPASGYRYCPYCKDHIQLRGI